MTWFEMIKFNIEYSIDMIIERVWKIPNESVKSLRFYFTTARRHRWWDYHFQVVMIDRMLQQCEKHWGKDTHYVGDKFTLGRIKVIRKYIHLYRTTHEHTKETLYLKKALRYYAANIQRFWD